MKIPSAFLTSSLVSQPRKAGGCYRLFLQLGMSEQLVPHLALSPQSPAQKRGNHLAGKWRKQAVFSQKKNQQKTKQNPGDFVASLEKAEEFSKLLFICKLVISPA